MIVKSWLLGIGKQNRERFVHICSKLLFKVNEFVQEHFFRKILFIIFIQDLASTFHMIGLQ